MATLFIKRTGKVHFITAVVMVLFVGLILLGSKVWDGDNASAISAFNPGNIISNSVMADYTSMSEAQIRSFINQRNANCPSSNSLCLKNYRENGADAARIIYVAAQEQRINPQVILVTIQKEKGLVTSTAPAQWMYNSAMGYNCPDHRARCGSDERGFLRQVIWGSTMYRAILDGGGKWSNRYSSGSLWYTPYVLGNNSIQWHPNISCGTSTVNIQNRATQALYNYTPYRPNQAALSAGYGTGDDCSSYGNRNFYLYMRDWFNGGVPRFSQLSDVRFMETARDTEKIDVESDRRVGGVVTAGTQVRFATKATYDGRDCLRTQVDTDRDAPYCIPIADLKEVSIAPTSITPQSMILNTKASKYDMRRNTKVGGDLERFRQVTITGEFTIAGIKFYVTDRDMREGLEYGFREDSLTLSQAYTTMDVTLMRTTDRTDKVVPTTGEIVGSINKDELLQVRSYVEKDDGLYYRVVDDHSAQLDVGVSASAIQELEFKPFAQPRWMRLTTSLYKYDLVANSNYGILLQQGREVFFDSKVTVNGREYYRTSHDTANNNPHVIPANNVTGSLLNNFSNFAIPRNMTVVRDTHKIDLYTGRQVEGRLSAGRVIHFGTKITHNGREYFRTSVDGKSGNVYGIPANDLR